MPTTALPETFVPCRRSIGRSNATGTKCCAAGVGPGASRGTCSTGLNSVTRSCDQICTFPIGSYKLSQCCESSSEERSAGNLHATFCGNRGRATASGDPVKSQQWLRYPINPHAAFDVEGTGDVARHRPKPARQSSPLPLSGVWKRSHGRTSEAPPDERGGNRYVRPTATAPHSDSTRIGRSFGGKSTMP